MEVIYTCENTNCSFPSEGRYELVFRCKSIMDEKNVATFFCPYCKEKLKTGGYREAAGF